MTKLSQFVDMGSDTSTCEYLSKSMGDDTLQKSGVDMDIIKAKREGLVPKMVEVHGPHGTYQAVRMVRPGEKPKAGKSSKGNALSALSKQEATCEISDLEVDDYPVISQFSPNSKMYSSEDAEDDEAFEKLYNDISSNMKDKVEAEQDGDGNDWTVGTYNGKKVAISDGIGGQAIIVGGKKKS